MALRDYDAAVVASFQPAVVAVEGINTHQVTVPGIAAPVPLYVGLPEEWYAKHALPALNVTRAGLMPDPTRRLPGFLITELSTNPSFPNTFNVQKYSVQPYNFLYAVEAAATRQAEMNALLEHVLLRLPPHGLGSFVTVNTRMIPYEQTDVRDMTDYSQNQDGRVYRWVLSYSVQGWLTPLECLKVPQILTVDAEVLPEDPPAA